MRKNADNLYFPETMENDYWLDSQNVKRAHLRNNFECLGSIPWTIKTECFKRLANVWIFSRGV